MFGNLATQGIVKFNPGLIDSESLCVDGELYTNYRARIREQNTIYYLSAASLSLSRLNYGSHMSIQIPLITACLLNFSAVKSCHNG